MKTGSPGGSAPLVLTLAQAKAGLLAAARGGLIDGSELNESWFQTLRRDVYNAAKKGKKSDDVRSPKEKKEKAKATPTPKKISPAVSGFTKFAEKAAGLEVPGSVNNVDLMKEFCKTPHNSKILKIFVTRHNYVDESGKAVNVEMYKNMFLDNGLSEPEAKAARTWFPYFFAKIPNGAPKSERSEEEDN